MTWQESLRELEAVAAEVQLEDVAAIVAHASGAASTQSCTVALLGEWSRGKTTLVNALVRRNLLPVDIRPTTAGIVRVKPSSKEQSIRIRRDGTTERATIENTDIRGIQTTETGGTEDVDQLEVELIAPHLEGLELIDTPGVNDLRETASEIVYALLPHIDLAVFLLDASNGGLSASERAFLEARLLGEFEPPLAFVVSFMDRVEAEDEDERSEVEEEFREQIRGLTQADPVILFGSCSTKGTAADLADELLNAARQMESKSVEKRRLRVLQQARLHVRTTLRAELDAIRESSEETATRMRALTEARTALPASICRFRDHVHEQGMLPLLTMLDRSLELYAYETARDLERRVAMAGDVAAYAKHGLLADLEAANRAWTQRHVPEVYTFLRRHLEFVTRDFKANFGPAFGASGGLRLALPSTEALPELDTDAIGERQQRAELARYVLPGVLSVVGGMIALPIGVAGLYAGLKFASDHRAAEQSALKEELAANARGLAEMDAARMKEALGTAIRTYFDDLDNQLERATAALLSEANARIERTQAVRDAGEANRTERERQLGRALKALA